MLAGTEVEGEQHDASEPEDPPKKVLAKPKPKPKAKGAAVKAKAKAKSAAGPPPKAKAKSAADPAPKAKAKSLPPPKEKKAKGTPKKKAEPGENLLSTILFYVSMTSD